MNRVHSHPTAMPSGEGYILMIFDSHLVGNRPTTTQKSYSANFLTRKYLV